MFPASPLVAVPVSVLRDHAAPADSGMAAALFVATTGIDAVWHWRGEWQNITHHVLALLGTAVCLSCGSFGHLILCTTLVLETTGPFYQLLKLRFCSAWLNAHSRELRLLVLLSNLCVRCAYFVWLFLSVLVIAWNDATASELAVCAVCAANCPTGLFLDFGWSERVLRALGPDVNATPRRRSRRIVAGVSAIVCFSGAALLRRSFLPAIVVVNSVHYHIVAPNDPTAFVLDFGYNTVMMTFFSLTQPSVQLLVCVLISASGWYMGSRIARVLPVHAEIWHVTTCHVPAALAICLVDDLRL